MKADQKVKNCSYAISGCQEKCELTRRPRQIKLG